MRETGLDLGCTKSAPYWKKGYDWLGLTTGVEHRAASPHSIFIMAQDGHIPLQEDLEDAMMLARKAHGEGWDKERFAAHFRHSCYAVNKRKGRRIPV